MSGIVGSKLNIRGSGLVASYGTDGQHMLSAGPGKTNVFETVAAGADVVTLATGTISSAASFAIDGYFSSTYENYYILLSNIVPAAEATMRWRFNAGGSALTASKYRMMALAAHAQSGSSGHGVGSNWDTDYSQFTNEVIGDATELGASHRIWIPHPAQTSPEVYPMAKMEGRLGHSTVYRMYSGVTIYAASEDTAISGITVYMSDGGDIDSGEWIVYGIKP